MTKVETKKRQKQEKKASNTKPIKLSKAFIKVPDNILQCIKATDISDRLFQQFLALQHLSLNIHHAYPQGALMQLQNKEVKLASGRIVNKKQFMFLKDKHQINLKHKYKKMVGIKSNSQVTRSLNAMKAKGLLIRYGDYLMIHPALIPKKTHYVKIPTEIYSKVRGKKINKIWSRGFKAIAFVKMCLDVQKGPHAGRVETGCKKTKYNHRKKLKGILKKSTIEINMYQPQKIYLRNGLDFEPIDYWHTKKIKLKGQILLACDGKLYQKPLPSPHSDVALYKKGIKNRWVEFVSNPAKAQPVRETDEKGKKCVPLLKEVNINKKNLTDSENFSLKEAEKISSHKESSKFIRKIFNQTGSKIKTIDEQERPIKRKDDFLKKLKDYNDRFNDFENRKQEQLRRLREGTERPQVRPSNNRRWEEYYKYVRDKEKEEAKNGKRKYSKEIKDCNDIFDDLEKRKKEKEKNLHKVTRGFEKMSNKERFANFLKYINKRKKEKEKEEELKQELEKAKRRAFLKQYYEFSINKMQEIIKNSKEDYNGQFNDFEKRKQEQLRRL